VYVPFEEREDFASCPSSTVEDRRVPGLKGCKPDVGLADVEPGRLVSLTKAADKQFGQVRGEQFFELVVVLEQVRSCGETPVRRLKPLREERVHGVVVSDALLQQMAIPHIDADLGGLAIDQQVGSALCSTRSERVFKFPLRARHRHRAGDCAAVLFSRQGCAEASPADHHHDVGFAGRNDAVLKVLGRDEGFSLPEDRLHVCQVCEVATQTLNDPYGSMPLGTYVARGRDEDSKFSTLCAHGVAPSPINVWPCSPEPDVRRGYPSSAPRCTITASGRPITLQLLFDGRSRRAAGVGPRINRSGA
jgi:hypothetical protein